MWKYIGIIALLASAASSKLFESFVIEPEDEIIKSYKTARALLTPDQEEFLMELLAADDAILEAASRGIVDDVLSAISGVGNGQISVNIIGGGNQNPQPAGNPQVNLPTFTLVSSGNQPLISTPQRIQAPSVSAGNTPTLLADIPAGGAPTGAPIPGFQNIVNRVPQQSQGVRNQTTTTLGGNNNHLFSTISSVIVNSSRRNVTGIVDESLRIATPAPIREFVTGILGVVYCNSIRRLLGRC